MAPALGTGEKFCRCVGGLFRVCICVCVTIIEIVEKRKRCVGVHYFRFCVFMDCCPIAADCKSFGAITVVATAVSSSLLVSMQMSSSRMSQLVDTFRICTRKSITEQFAEKCRFLFVTKMCVFQLYFYFLQISNNRERGSIKIERRERHKIRWKCYSTVRKCVVE